MRYIENANLSLIKRDRIELLYEIGHGKKCICICIYESNYRSDMIQYNNILKIVIVVLSFMTFVFCFIQLSDLNNTLSATCNVFECPEFHSFLLINNVSVYDYYSIYSKPLREYT